MWIEIPFQATRSRNPDLCIMWIRGQHTLCAFQMNIQHPPPSVSDDFANGRISPRNSHRTKISALLQNLPIFDFCSQGATRIARTQLQPLLQPSRWMLLKNISGVLEFVTCHGNWALNSAGRTRSVQRTVICRRLLSAKRKPEIKVPSRRRCRVSFKYIVWDSSLKSYDYYHFDIMIDFDINHHVNGDHTLH
jgi:hypothetical protein